MDTLRIILGIAGIVFIIGLYLYQDKNRRFDFSFHKILLSFQPFKHALEKILKINIARQSKVDVRYQQMDSLSSELIDDMSDIVTNESGNHSVSIRNTISKPKVSSSQQDGLLVSLTVLPKQGMTFNGNDILNACKIAGLQLGEYNIFHRYAIVDGKVLMTPVCSLVNLFEPGYFDITDMDDFTTQGLSLFMQLPGPVDGRDAFIILMDVADKLSANLNATIGDETKSVLTTQTISHLKEKIESFRFKLKMDSLREH